MNKIINNPYRILGLLSGTKAAEQSRQIKRLKQFIEAEQESDADFSFPILGNLPRELNDVDDAVQKINLDSDKINTALFWFYNGNSITDEPAFDELKDGNIDKTIAIWSKLVTNEITKKNASATSNLATIFLWSVFNSDNISNINFLKTQIKESVLLKLCFLESDFVFEYINLITDETFKISKEQLQIQFLNQVYTEIENINLLSINEFFEIINQIEFSAKENFQMNFVKKLTEEIEKKIEKTKFNRKSNINKSLEYGYKLLEITIDDLSIIRSILGIENIKFSSISDKVADEVLQCGIEYFNYFKDNDSNSGNDAMALFQKAEKLAIGKIEKQRCKENILNLQEWIDDPENLIKEELQELILLFDEFNNPETLFSEYKNGYTTYKYIFLSKIDESFSLLLLINKKIGKENPLYINLCSSLSDLIINRMVNDVNNSIGISSLLIDETHDVLIKLDLLPKNDTSLKYLKQTKEGLMKIDPILSAGKLINSPLNKAKKELNSSKEKLIETKNKVFFKMEIDEAKSKLKNIKSWQPFRSQNQKEIQIDEQEEKIKKLILKSENEKKTEIKRLEKLIISVENKIKNIEIESKLYK